MKKLIVFLCVIVFISTPGMAALIELKFDSLPSEQGWSYIGETESTVASVDGSKLTINTNGLGAVSAFYQMVNIVEPDLPFTLSTRVRFVEDSEDFDRFAFQARHGLEVWSMDLTPSNVIITGQPLIPINGTEFHDLVIEGIPGVQAFYYIDGSLVVSTTPFVSNVSSRRIAFGDGNAVPSRITNAHVEITDLTFNQGEPPAVPEPTTLILLGSGLIGLAGLRRKLRK